MSERKIFSAIPTSLDKNTQTLNIKKTNSVLVPQNNSTEELIPEEKKEIAEIYTIYHDKLSGNGNGERYYKEIIELPESPEELKARQLQGRS